MLWPEPHRQRCPEAAEISRSIQRGEFAESVARARRDRKPAGVDVIPQTECAKHAGAQILLRPVTELHGRLDHTTHDVESETDENIRDVLGTGALAGEDRSRAPIEIPCVHQHGGAAERVVQSNLRDVPIAGVVDRSANVVVPKFRVCETNGEASRPEWMIESDARLVFVPGLEARTSAGVSDEWLVGRALSQTPAEAKIPRADRPCDGDSSRGTETGSHVRDRKREKVVADAEGGQLLRFRCRLVPGRNVQA